MWRENGTRILLEASKVPEDRLKLLNVFSLPGKKTGLAAAVTVSLSCFCDAGCGFKLQLGEERKKKREYKQQECSKVRGGGGGHQM